MNENNLIETARQKAKDGDLQTAKAILEALDSERAKALLNKVNLAIASEKQKALANRKQAPEKPKNASLSSQIAEGIKQADKAKQQQQAKYTGYSMLFIVLLACSCCAWVAWIGQNAPEYTPSGNTSTGDAVLIESAVELVTDIDVSSVQITNGTIIMSYTSSASDETELFAEYGSIFGAVGGAVREFGIDARELAIVAGDRNGMAIETVIVQISDILAFLEDDISAEVFFGRISRVDF